MRKRRTTREPSEKYGAIADALRGRIRAGALPPGERLPSRRELARTFGVTLVTMQKAFDVLRDDGFVSGHVGRGTFVVEHPPHRYHYALLVSDDNLAEAAIAGLATAGLRIPRDLDAINNFPLPLDVPATVRQLGFGITERIDACLDTLRAMAANRRIPETVHISPRFACESDDEMKQDPRESTRRRSNTERKEHGRKDATGDPSDHAGPDAR